MLSAKLWGFVKAVAKKIFAPGATSCTISIMAVPSPVPGRPLWPGTVTVSAGRSPVEMDCSLKSSLSESTPTRTPGQLGSERSVALGGHGAGRRDRGRHHERLGDRLLHGSDSLGAIVRSELEVLDRIGRARAPRGRDLRRTQARHAGQLGDLLVVL